MNNAVVISMAIDAIIHSIFYILAFKSKSTQTISLCEIRNANYFLK